MRRRRVAAVIGVTATAALIFSASASAGTVIGNNCSANSSLGTPIIALKNPVGYPLPSAIPSAGVITNWTFSLGLPIPSELLVTEQLKVFAPTGVPNQFKVVGESAVSPVGVGLTSLPTRISVQNGDLLGSITTVTSPGKTEQGALLCKTEDAGDEIAVIPGNAPTGSTVSATMGEPGSQNPVTVTVEPDADADGYGDETQDKCPTDASTQGPCPAPPAPPAPRVTPPPLTLSASAAAKKGLVTVTLTDSAQASVTVGGSVNLGKGKSVKLSGGTQLVAPGTLAKFTVVFPAKLKAALKHLPTSKKLPLVLTASAPGATSTNLTVKVPGQQRVQLRHPKK
jgi:hypothetical protein